MDHALAAQKDQIDVVLEGGTGHIEEGPADMDPVLAAEGDRIGGPSLKRKRLQDSLTSPQTSPHAGTGPPPLSPPGANPPAGSRRNLRFSSRLAGNADSATALGLGVASEPGSTGGGRAARDRKGKGREGINQALSEIYCHFCIQIRTLTCKFPDA